MHVSRQSSHVDPAILQAQLVEGTAVVRTSSGVVNGFGTDLPRAVAASTNDVQSVYILEAAPDNFPRPVDTRQYRAGNYVSMPTDDTGYGDPIQTPTLYYVGISNLYNPTIPSGFKVLMHKGGTYVVPAACFIDSAGIKVPGAKIRVGAGGKWEVTSTASEAVGTVIEYRADVEELTFELWD